MGVNRNPLPGTTRGIHQIAGMRDTLEHVRARLTSDRASARHEKERTRALRGLQSKESAAALDENQV